MNKTSTLASTASHVHLAAKRPRIGAKHRNASKHNNGEMCEKLSRTQEVW